VVYCGQQPGRWVRRARERAIANDDVKVAMGRTADSDKAPKPGRRLRARARRKTFLSCASLALLVSAILLLGLGGLVTGLSGIRRSGSIPEPWLAGPGSQELPSPRPTGVPAPIPHVPIPDHPFMAAGDGNNIPCGAC
jgi:hypothetical protein